MNENLQVLEQQRNKRITMMKKEVEELALARELHQLREWHQGAVPQAVLVTLGVLKDVKEFEGYSEEKTKEVVEYIEKMYSQVFGELPKVEEK